MQSVMQIEKLKGRENFDTWKLAAKSYLVIKGLWKCIESSTSVINPDDDLKARSEITLLLDPINYSHVQEAETAMEAWDNLKTAFSDSGTCRRVDTLQRLVTLKLSDCSSMEDYISKIMQFWIKAKSVGFDIKSDIVGVLMLGGLPSQYRPLVMAMENSGKELTADHVKTTLLQDVSFEDKNTNNEAALFSKSKHKNKKGNKQHSQYKSQIECFKCGGKGHFARKCPKNSSTEKHKENVLYTS